MIAQRSELETLFVNCIEEVRKEIMKRRLKSEVYQSKKPAETVENANEFEQTLMRVVQFTKKKVKIEDFTQHDKFNLLDLFVNNEKTLIKIYEALFPPKQPSFYQLNQQIPSGTMQSSKSNTMFRQSGQFKQTGSF